MSSALYIIDCLGIPMAHGERQLDNAEILSPSLNTTMGHSLIARLPESPIGKEPCPDTGLSLVIDSAAVRFVFESVTNQLEYSSHLLADIGPGILVEMLHDAIQPYSVKRLPWTNHKERIYLD